MGYKEDQRLPSERDDTPPPPYRPPLPPRSSKSTTQLENITPEHPPLKLHARPTNLPWVDQDPRRRSTESLVPHDHTSDKRVLLIIYIHGFVGDETSFRSFPAHVHNLATQLLIETHVVHTKIYPRYKSRRAINFARDDFSRWLSPHESSSTDVVLVGHSMGGMLASDVVLLQSSNKAGFVHRILGTINFDTPFLGMHPGVIKSGLGSLFKPTSPATELKPENMQSNDNVLLPHGSAGGSSASIVSGAESISSTNFIQPVNDPNFNPAFSNDVKIPVRKGWQNAKHFLNKHSDDLMHAAKSYVTSHLEFGGAMADYKALRSRYDNVRSLENVQRPGEGSASQQYMRVRFVNYYTASTGKSKAKSPSPNDRRALSPHPYRTDNDTSRFSASSDNEPRSRSRSPMSSVAGQTTSLRSATDGAGRLSYDAESISQHYRTQSSATNDASDQVPSATIIDYLDGHTKNIDLEARETEPLRSHETDQAAQETETIEVSLDRRAAAVDCKLPELLPPPIRVTDFDPNLYKDDDIRKIAEKDYKRRVKAYDQASKDRDEAIKDRIKAIEKREKTFLKENQKRSKQLKSLQEGEASTIKQDSFDSQDSEIGPSVSQRQSLERGSIAGPSSDGDYESADEMETAELQPSENAKSGEVSVPRKKKDKKFCMLPKKGVSGQRDPTWIRVYMEGVDEVGAHCGLFFTDRPHYEKLVSDVSYKLLEWVTEARGT